MDYGQTKKQQNKKTCMQQFETKNIDDFMLWVMRTITQWHFYFYLLNILG